MSTSIVERERAMDLQAKVAFLKQPQTYPDHPSRVETIETHMSWVFLTEREAYKLKKPVRYDFLDFSTLAARKRNCGEEVRLNQRLAPGVYRGMAALTLDARGEVQIDGQGEIVEWLVKMRRLPAERMLDYLIRHQALEPTEVQVVAEMLAHFYRESAAFEISGNDYRHQYARNVRTNRDALANPVYGLPAALVDAVHDAQNEFLQRAPDLFERRAEEGRIIEGHGDLRPEHVCLESPPVIFDRLEFNRAFRIIDAADELAFLAMECERLGASQVEQELFGAYRRVTGDYPPPSLVYFYKSHRACVHARLAIWHTHDLAESAWPRWRAVAEEYLRLAESYNGKL
jgi:aminoglycoside phosphotransferase family enzyme